jgi:hypothetical protein
MHAELTAKAISVETSTAPRYVDAGSGVARTRLRIPDSRRMTMKIARPAKAVETRPYPSMPASRKFAPRSPLIVSSP